MSDVKWIKIVTDIFDDEKMYAIEALPDGQLIELVWFKILCLAGKCNQNGFLTISNKIAYTDEMLSKIFRMELGTIQRALSTFEQLEMIETVENAYMVSNWLLYQSGDRLEEIKEKNKIRQQRYRDNQKVQKIGLEEKRNVTHNVTNNVIPSYSNKSNISNLNYLLDTYREEYIYITNNNTLLDIIKYWLEYKQDKGKQHLIYAERSLKGLLEKFIEMDKQYGTNGVDKAVKDTVTNGWQGIVWEKAEIKNNRKEQSNGTADRGNDTDRYKKLFEQAKAKGASDEQARAIAESML